MPLYQIAVNEAVCAVGGFKLHRISSCWLSAEVSCFLNVKMSMKAADTEIYVLPVCWQPEGGKRTMKQNRAGS